MGCVAGPGDPAGREKARRQAQANANFFQRKYVVFQAHNGGWYQERWSEDLSPREGREVVEPQPGSVLGRSDVPE